MLFGSQKNGRTVCTHNHTVAHAHHTARSFGNQATKRPETLSTDDTSTMHRKWMHTQTIASPSCVETSFSGPPVLVFDLCWRDAYTAKMRSKLQIRIRKLGNKKQARENKATKPRATGNKNLKHFSSHNKEKNTRKALQGFSSDEIKNKATRNRQQEQTLERRTVGE